MFRCRHEEVSATEAINPLRECSGWGGKPNPVKVIFLYGSWNRRCCSIVQECEGLHYSALTVVEKLRCDLLKEETSMGNNVLYLTVKVDDDDECIDVCTRSVKDGGLEVPPELPCVLLLAHLPTSTGSTEMRVEHVECRNLEQAFVDTYEDTESEYGKPTSSVAVENLTSSLKEAWSRLFDAKGSILPPQPKQSKAKNAVSKRQVKTEPAIRIFVAGDKSQVGKSSICMVRLLFVVFYRIAVHCLKLLYDCHY